MTSSSELYDRLKEGVAFRSEDAGIRFATSLQPSGGPGTRVMPPTYPGAQRYLVGKRRIGDTVTDAVLLDSYQSQANRIEEAVLEARDDGHLALPLFEMEVRVEPWTVRLTSLDFPHRYADAYLRDSTIGGVPFDQTDTGKALRVASPERADALYRHDPMSLVLGAWNSHRKGRQPKFARCYRSEVLGLDATQDQRRGGRLDPFNLTGSVDHAVGLDGDWRFVGDAKEKKKGEKLSEIGHGNALSGEAPGGVTISEARRLGFLSFASLDRLRFQGLRAEAAVPARVALAALALVGDRLAFDRPGVVYRSGCELTTVEDVVAWEQRGGTAEALEVDTATALDAFRTAVQETADAGLEMDTSTVSIEPISGLRDAISHSLLAADTQE